MKKPCLYLHNSHQTKPFKKQVWRRRRDFLILFCPTNLLGKPITLHHFASHCAAAEAVVLYYVGFIFQLFILACAVLWFPSLKTLALLEQSFCA